MGFATFVFLAVCDGAGGFSREWMVEKNTYFTVSRIRRKHFTGFSGKIYSLEPSHAESS